MKDFKVLSGHQDSVWKVMNQCELVQSDGNLLRITTMGCPTVKVGTLIQTVTDSIGKNGIIQSTSANLYHIPSSRLRPQKGEDGGVVGYILVSETEPEV